MSFSSNLDVHSNTWDDRDGRSALDDKSTLVGTDISLKKHGSVVSDLSRCKLEDLLKANVCVEHETLSCFKDLMAFRVSLLTPMNDAWKLLDETDKDLADCLDYTHKEVCELMDHAVRVVMSFAATAQQTQCSVLPGLRVAVTKAKRHIVVSLLGSAQGWISDMKKAAKEVRCKYVLLLDKVRYLMKCTLLVLDHLAMMFEECTEQDEFASLNQKMENIELAIQELEKGEKTLEECSEFWLILHTAELKLFHIEDEAQRLRSALLGGSRVAVLPPEYMEFCVSLEQVCKEYCIVDAPETAASNTSERASAPEAAHDATMRSSGSSSSTAILEPLGNMRGDNSTLP